MHEATARLMAGASPARTQQLLGRNLHRRKVQQAEKDDEDELDKYSAGDREYATALMLACQHLPASVMSTPGQKAAMLSEAVKMYKKLGDKKSLQNCQNMMMKMAC